MFKFEIIAENAQELKDKLNDLASLFGTGPVARVVTENKVYVEELVKHVEEKVEPVKEEIAIENDPVIALEEDVEEEEETDNIATKMTYWELDGEFGNTRKGAVIPDDAKLFSSKAMWEAAQDEVETTTKTNFPPKEEAEPVTRDQVVKKMGDLLRADGSVKSTLSGLLARFDAQKFGQVKEGDYAEFHAGLISIEKEKGL